MQHSPTASAFSSSSRSSRPVPLLSLAPPALALGDALALGESGAEHHVGEIWNVITRAADLVKDGERLENLAWRHWGQPHRERRASSSSIATGSSISLHTPTHELPSPSFDRPRSYDRRSFGGALKLLLEEDNFKDWVGDAKRNVPVPVLSVPDTPVADVEIRLVEPTPVPSRVGSLGGSLAASGLLTIAAVPPKLSEEGEMEETNEELEDGMPVASSSKAQSKSRPRSPRKKGKFFVHSSPSKGSGSDSPHPSPTIPSETAQTHPTLPQPPRRQSSGSSSGGVMMKLKKGKEKEERNLSLSTMKGKFASEKRKMARALAAAKEDEEGSGWEDEVEEQGAAEGDEAWSDEPDSPKKPKREKRRSSSRSRSGRSSSNLELTHLLTRQRSNRTPPKDVPPPPAPTPLRRMSKKERQAAAAERAKIETELEARTKRQMFAKKQIFGGRLAGEGLLSQVLKSGGSMVDLTQAKDGSRPAIRPSPTHGHLPSFGRSPTPGPSLLRSKSAVAMPVQSGVSITVWPHGADHLMRHTSKRRPSKEMQEERVPADMALETSDEDTDDDYLANSTTQRKIAELAAKRDTKTQPVPAGHRLDENGVVQPLSPTTRRRGIIMREMSESLRHNLILERQKSSGGTSRHNSTGQQTSRLPPSTHTSVIPAREAALNRVSHSQGPPLARIRSQPVMQDVPQGPFSTTSPSPTSIQATLPPSRRTQSNVLGGGFLRPLTRVGENSPIIRTQSSANLVPSGQSSPRSASPLALEAPAMTRRSTDGDGRASSDEMRRQELARRSETMDTSYRSHGW